MLLGVAHFPTMAGMPVRALAARAEALGYDSLVVPEHSYIPEVESTFPTGAPVTWAHGACLDPFVALATAAATTSTLLLGTVPVADLAGTAIRSLPVRKHEISAALLK